MIKKSIHYIIAVLFLLFALVQWNDPDYMKWMPPYLIMSYIALQAGRERYYRLWTGLLIILFVIWMVPYLPHMRDWLSDGMPTITGSMKAESPYIELSREFFGLLLCLIATIYYFYLATKNKN